MAVSPHGLGFAIAQTLLVLTLWVVLYRWYQRTPTARPFWIVTGALVLEYAVLRYQPIRMGGDPFEYTLGLFDAATALGLAGLVGLETMRRSRQ